jgi:hypothetical protein
MKTAAIVFLRLLIGGLFLWAGLSKLGSPLQTLATVYSYQVVLPDLLASLVAAALPWMEILLGTALLAGIWLPVATGWTATLLVFFSMMTAQAWWRELPIDCGCVDLSVLHPALAALTTPGGATLRNLVLLVLTVLLAVLARKKAAA